RVVRNALVCRDQIVRLCEIYLLAGSKAGCYGFRVRACREAKTFNSELPTKISAALRPVRLQQGINVRLRDVLTEPNQKLAVPPPGFLRGLYRPPRDTGTP